MMKRAMCAWLPCWPLQRILVTRPEHKNHPLVLYKEDNRNGRRVAFCCRAAAAGGVAPGMPLAEAQGLLEASRDSVFLLHRPDDDATALQRLAVWCQRFSPIVGIEAPDSLLLDLTGCTHLFGGERRLQLRFHEALQQWRLVVRSAIADTIGTAWAVARFGTERMASMACGQHEAALRPLPVAALRLPDKAVQTLEELNVRRIEQLRALPRNSLSSRLGPEVARRLDQALGQIPELIAPVQAPLPVEANREFEHSTGSRRELEFVLQQLVEQLASDFAGRGEGVQQLDIRLTSSQQPVEFTVGLLRATQSVSHLMSLVRAKLERLSPGEAITGVTLKASAIALLESHQTRLFESEDNAEHQRELARLVDLLSSRLGTQRVVRPRLRAEAQPELAVQWTPMLDSPVGRPATAATTASRPLRLLEKPQAVQVMSVVPDGPPIRLFRSNDDFAIARHWGPERIETGWWRGPSVRRDYYRVETECGRRFWLFRRLNEGDWFLHGEFE